MKRWLAKFLGIEPLNAREQRGTIEALEQHVKILRAQRDRKVLPFSEPPAIAPDWLPDHRNAWRTFLFSPVGQTLFARARAIQFHNNTRACADVFHTSHSAGAAKGFGECLDWLESLSRTSARSTDDSEPENKGQNDATPSGETAIRDSMSP